MTDAQVARDIAQAAGALLLNLRAQGASGAEADLRANALILARLAEQRPADAFLSEESKCDGARLAASRVWVIDPLDGTREFAEGRDDWAVHIGLAIDGAPVAGAVALPALGQCWASDVLPPPNLSPPRAAAAPPRLVVSRSRPPREAQLVAEALGADMLPMGSAGAKAMAVLRGDADVYLHAGGQYEWDNCAPAAVALAAGLHVSRINGAPLLYNRADPHLPDLLICRSNLAAPILALLA